ncbi:TlpA family protein disulfide reductase [Pontibacter liquoris]|uniref:TlpA family protein disulfide reductase n=1 Tax=Pontibacter liquoris TaxID=2905677 RepID=UPI001FA7F43E|nr:redoxin domain-containing protein [Pontibacter liquoris]
MKKILISVVAALVVVTAIFYVILKKNAAKEQEAAPVVAKNATNELPWLPMTNADGTRFMAHSLKGKTILVLFQPDCDHCQREATQISEHLEAFAPYNVYFVSDAGAPQLLKFAQDYKLAGQQNIHFTSATANDIYENMGSTPVPAMYVFSEEGKLVKSFIGETPIEVILHYLK